MKLFDRLAENAVVKLLNCPGIDNKIKNFMNEGNMVFKRTSGKFDGCLDDTLFHRGILAIVKMSVCVLLRVFTSRVKSISFKLQVCNSKVMASR